MVSISFIGDIGLNDDYIELKRSQAEPFNEMKPVLTSTDLLVGNLECILKGDQGENLLKRPRLSTTPETLEYLNSIHLGLATLATNHVYDNLESGFQKTINFLNTNNISHIGAGLDEQSADKPFIFEKNNISVCFLNYITRDTNPSMPAFSKVSIHEFELENCIGDLNCYKEYDHRVVVMHWGGRFEGGLYPDYDQIELARKLIDNGADLIVGHHSHTLQPFEIYKGKHIFYSLGNFCFSDIKFEGSIRKMSSLRERESIVASINFDKSRYSVKLFPFRNEHLVLRPRKLVRYKLRARNACFMLLKFKPFWNLYRLSFFKFRPIWVQLLRKDEKRSLVIRIKEYLTSRKRS